MKWKEKNYIWDVLKNIKTELIFDNRKNNEWNVQNSPHSIP